MRGTVVTMLPEFTPELSAEEECRLVDALRRAVSAYPEAAGDLVERGEARGARRQALALLAHLCERTLGRAPTDAERRRLGDRLDRDDALHVADEVQGLDREALEKWLAVTGA